MGQLFYLLLADYYELVKLQEEGLVTKGLLNLLSSIATSSTYSLDTIRRRLPEASAHEESQKPIKGSIVGFT
jgi:hypothetical protein